MTYVSGRRNHNEFGRKIARYFTYRKAKRLCNEINRDMSAFEARFIRSRLNHA